MKQERRQWVEGILRTLGAAAGMAALAWGAAPGTMAAGEPMETLQEQAAQVSVQTGANATMIWGFVFAMAALGIIAAEIARKKKHNG